MAGADSSFLSALPSADPHPDPTGVTAALQQLASRVWPDRQLSARFRSTVFRARGLGFLNLAAGGADANGDGDVKFSGLDREFRRQVVTPRCPSVGSHKRSTRTTRCCYATSAWPRISWQSFTFETKEEHPRSSQHFTKVDFGEVSLNSTVGKERAVETIARIPAESMN
jgi:hypothetical protein